LSALFLVGSRPTRPHFAIDARNISKNVSVGHVEEEENSDHELLDLAESVINQRLRPLKKLNTPDWLLGLSLKSEQLSFWQMSTRAIFMYVAPSLLSGLAKARSGDRGPTTRLFIVPSPGRSSS
jgi:hypothetical protein